jgi:hypothetical protein
MHTQFVSSKCIGRELQLWGYKLSSLLEWLAGIMWREGVEVQLSRIDMYVSND